MCYYTTHLFLMRNIALTINKCISAIADMLYHLIVSLLLCVIGMCGVFMSRKNVILTIMSLEVMLLAVNYNLIFFSTYLDDLLGNVCTLFVLTVGACESAIGLALVISFYKANRW